MDKFPSGDCRGTVVWKVVGGARFPVDPTPPDGDCAAASVFEIKGVIHRVDKDRGLPDPEFKELRKAFPEDVKKVPNAKDEFTLPMVPRGTKVVVP